MLLTVDSLTEFAPKARHDYLKILADQGNDVLTRFGINRNERRFCHFMAQVGHECGGFTIVEESGAYSAAGIMRIFGVGRHSAAVTEPEAKRIAAIQPVAKRGEVLFERVYGPERSPRKARDLGNTQPGDGYKYRGRGFLQITGRSAYREMGRRIGLDLENNPSLAGEPIGALMTAAAYWDSRKLNTHADQNNIERITKLINGGQNGLADRRAKLAKALEIWGEGDSRGGLRRSGPVDAGDGTLAYGDLGPEVVEVKRMLSALGYEGFVMDEDFSKATHLAVASYQIDRGIPGNGIVDAETRRSLMQDAASAGYSPESVKRGGPPVPNPVPKQHPETEPTSFNWGRGRAVWVWSVVFLLTAGAYLGLRVLDNPNLFRSQSPADWATIGFAGLVGLGSIILWALGHRIARSSKRRAVLRHGERGLPPDEGLRRDPDSTG